LVCFTSTSGFDPFEAGSDEFRWNVHESGKFSVDSMYKALIQPEVPVDDNNKILKMKILLKTKIFAWYLRRGVALTRDNLENAIDMEVIRVSFVIKK
jgi:hypothetical protein